MIYSSPFFVFFFLAALLVYFSISNKNRPVFLILINTIWYSAFGLYWSLFFLGFTILTFFILLYAENKNLLANKLFFGLFLALWVIVFYVLKTLGLYNSDWRTPYGISFYFLTLLAYIMDARRRVGAINKQHFHAATLMPSFFPALVGGPILRSGQFFNQVNANKELSLSLIINGLLIFFFGYYKFLFLHDTANLLSSRFFVSPKENFSLFLLGCLLFTFKSYIEFSSYCDMGRGVAYCFGYKLPINFRPFYYAKNPNDLWARWNVTLGEWIRDYISFPLMLRFGKVINQSLLIVFSFLLVGLWHGVTLNWLIFGLYNGFVISLFYYLQLQLTSKAPLVLRISGRLLAVLLILGNGLLVNVRFLEILNVGLVADSINYNLINWSMFYISLFILLVIEYFQERLKNLDFYLNFSFTIRILLFLVACFGFLFILYNSYYLDFYELPPAYFKF